MSKIEKIKEMDLVSVDNARIKQVIDTYFHWKQLDAEIKTLSGTLTTIRQGIGKMHLATLLC